jgi:hypothetical protein
MLRSTADRRNFDPQSGEDKAGRREQRNLPAPFPRFRECVAAHRRDWSIMEQKEFTTRTYCVSILADMG